MAEKQGLPAGKGDEAQATAHPPLAPSAPAAPPAYESLFGQRQVAKCQVHTLEDVTMFCEDHQTLCCKTCSNVQQLHRFCPGLKSIADAVQGKSFKQQLEQATNEMRRKQLDVEMARDMRLQMNLALDQAMARVVSFGQVLQQRIAENAGALKQNLVADTVTCNAFVADTANQLQHMTISDTTDQATMFVDVQVANQRIREADLLMGKLLESNDQLANFKVGVDKEIEQLVNGIGEFENIVKTQMLQAASANVSPLVPILPGVDHTYELVSGNRHSFKIYQDDIPIEIKGCCQLSNGQLLMADYKNSRVILIAPGTYTVIDSIKTQHPPPSIRTVSGTTAVTSYESLSQDPIVFFDVNDNNIDNPRCMEAQLGPMKHLTPVLNEIFVLTDGIKVASHEAQFLRKLKVKGANPCLGKRITANHDGSKIYMTGNFPNDTVMVTLDRNGEVLAKLKDSRIKEAFDVCLDKAGNVFVSGKRSNNVCQVTRAGDRVLSVLATAADGLEEPRAVCFDQNNSTLLVANGGKKGRGEFYAFKLK